MTELTKLWRTLTDRSIETLRVQQHDERGGLDAGLARAFWFREDGPGGVNEMRVGPNQGEDAERSAYDWWPVYLGDERVAELRDDAAGYALHVKVNAG